MADLVNMADPLNRYKLILSRYEEGKVNPSTANELYRGRVSDEVMSEILSGNLNYFGDKNAR